MVTDVSDACVTQSLFELSNVYLRSFIITVKLLRLSLLLNRSVSASFPLVLTSATNVTVHPDVPPPPPPPPPPPQVIYELPTINQWCFDVQWCPRNPALLSTASFDGKISVYSVMGGSLEAQQQSTVDKVSSSFFSSPSSPSSSCSLFIYVDATLVSETRSVNRE